MSSDSDLELDSLDARSDSSLLDSASSSSYAPDEPLATAAANNRPRWQQPRRSAVARLVAALCVAPRRRGILRLVAAACLAAGVLYAAARVADGRGPLLAKALPASYAGSLAVGTVDVEARVAARRNVTHAGADVRFRSSGAPAFELDTVLVTLFYPAAEGATTTTTQQKQHPWLDRPVGLTAAGYARFVGADWAPVRAVLTLVLWAVAGSLRVPAAVDAPLLPPGHNDGARLPVVVFSHGMASSRTDYTYYLGGLASRGYVVAALEHRDGSCPGTLVRRGGGEPDRPLVHFGLDDVVTLNSSDVDLAAFKRHQLAFRTAEMAEAVSLLRDLDAGHGARIHAANPRAEGSSLPSWRHRLALDRLVVAGHSYGATGALQAVADPAVADPAVAAPPPRAAIALDPGKASGPLSDNVSAPLLVVHSDSWSRAPALLLGRPHFSAVRDLVRAALARLRHRNATLPAAWFLTSLGTAHPSVSDAPLIEPLLLRWATRTSLDPRRALRQYVDLSADFLDALGSRAPAAGLLAEAVTHHEYGAWVSEERRHSFPEHWAKLWEIHVSPAPGDK